MYSSASESDYQLRREKAEQEARVAYRRSAPFRNPVSVVSSEQSSQAETECVATPTSSVGGLSGFLSRIKEDDVLLIAILFLLFNENKEDDPLILIILAVLLFS